MNDEKIIASNKELFYSYDGNGQFKSELIAHGTAGTNIYLQQMWDYYHDRLIKAREDVIAGKRSPICYHLERTLMDTITLAVYMGYRPGKVKRHFKPRVYKRLKPAVLAKYAEIFEISVDQLENVNIK